MHGTSQSVSANVYYTLVDAVAKGAFSVINIYEPTDNIKNMTVKISIDALAPYENVLGWGGRQRSISLDYGGAANLRAILDYGLLCFDSRLKIEFKCSVVCTIDMSVMYYLFP